MCQEIKDQIKQVNKGISDLRHDDDAVYQLPQKVEHILKLIDDLYKATSDDMLKLHCKHSSGNLNHTLHKEVELAESAYQKTLKKNAARKRTTEYRQNVIEAIQQINTDIRILLV